MSHNSNLRKDETLGMPHGTAAGKLRKNILFHLLKKHSENVCVRCSKIIEDVRELSIEHLKPWEGISAELFWDLNNIAFSHTQCNRPHRTTSLRKVGPIGTSWCSKHQAFRPIDEFHKKSSSWNGLDDYCKFCRVVLDSRVNHAKKV
jgi:hypothetical protein